MAAGRIGDSQEDAARIAWPGPEAQARRSRNHPHNGDGSVRTNRTFKQRIAAGSVPTALFRESGPGPAYRSEPMRHF